MPDVIFLLLIANSLAFALQILLPGVFERYFALWPIDSYRNYFSVWQLFTYGFLHGDFYHILFNMFIVTFHLSVFKFIPDKTEKRVLSSPNTTALL